MSLHEISRDDLELLILQGQQHQGAVRALHTTGQVFLQGFREVLLVGIQCDLREEVVRGWGCGVISDGGGMGFREVLLIGIQRDLGKEVVRGWGCGNGAISDGGGMYLYCASEVLVK